MKCSFCGVGCEQEREKELQFDKFVLTLDDGSACVEAVCLPELVPSLLGVSPLFYEQLEIKVSQLLVRKLAAGLVMHHHTDFADFPYIAMHFRRSKM
jgi:hypothetical protein